MDEKIYNFIGVDYSGNRVEDVKNFGLWWMIGFLFVVSFLGFFSFVLLRKVCFLYSIVRLYILYWFEYKNEVGS